MSAVKQLTTKLHRPHQREEGSDQFLEVGDRSSSVRSRIGPSMPSMLRRIPCLIAFFVVGLVITSLLYSDSDDPSASGAPSTYSQQQHHSDGVSTYSQKQHYLYWGYRIDCPGKHCDSCAGLGHQESSLRCALEEALVLGRTFVMPSQMCINQLHNDKGLLHSTSKSGKYEGWGIKTCSMDSLYDLELMSQTVNVMLDSSFEWQQTLSKAHLFNSTVNVKGLSRLELKQKFLHKEAMVINRTASPLAWFVECQNRKNHTSVLLPYSFLPTMAAKPLRLAAQKIIEQLGDFDAIHVRRGDKLKIRKDRFGVNRTLFPHLDRDTQATAIMRRVANWIPEGRTLFIASNERKPGFFDALGSKYKLVFISHFQSILDTVVQNNYQLFIIERLVLFGAKTYVKTFHETPSDLSLTDDGKKKIRAWEIPVYTFEESPSRL